MSEQAYFWLSVVNIGSAVINVIGLIDAIRMHYWMKDYLKSCEVGHD